jgi:hypothetical protein
MLDACVHLVAVAVLMFDACVHLVAVAVLMNAHVPQVRVLSEPDGAANQHKGKRRTFRSVLEACSRAVWTRVRFCLFRLRNQL